jgi:hypothetical protein
MTLRTLFLLFGIGCVLLAAVCFFGFDWGPGRDVTEDASGWAWLGVASVAASQLPWRGHWWGRGPA